MAEPTILTVDDDPAVSRSIARDLRKGAMSVHLVHRYLATT